MANRRLIHVWVEKDTEAVVPVRLHWLEVDEEWFTTEYDAIIGEVCNVVADNMDEFEKRAKSDGKLIFKRVAGIEKVVMAVAVTPQESSPHNVFVIGKDSNLLFQNTNYVLTMWLGPKDVVSAKRDVDWPVDCVC